MNEATSRKKVEVTSGESEGLFRAIFSQAAVGMAQRSVQGEWLLVNERFCEILGFNRAELGGKPIADFVHADDREASLDAHRRLLAGEISSSSLKCRHIRKDRTTAWTRVHTSLVRDQSNQPKYFIDVMEDISEKISTQNALVDSERYLGLAQDAAHVGVWDCNLITGEFRISSEFARLYGLPPSRDSLYWEEWLKRIHPDDRDRVQAIALDSLAQIQAWCTELRVVWPDRSIHWLIVKGAAFSGESGRAERMTGVTCDITQRKEAEAALRESEERFRNMADTAPVMICVSGSNKEATFFSKGWLDFTGRSMQQELGTGWMEGVHPDDAERSYANYSASFDTRANCIIEYRLRRSDGEYRWVLCNGVPRFAPNGVFAGYIASVIDITDMKRDQEQAFARQKLESMGVLAGGIAHDFNNLLGGILASTELALTEYVGGSRVDDELTRIRTACIRGAEIVRQLMIFGGQENPSFEVVDLSLVVGEMLNLLEVAISKNATLRVNFGEDVPCVEANPAQIRQVVMNLVTNASEAIGERQGVIGVTTARVTVNGNGLEGMNLPEGEYVRLEVSDTGVGMTPEVRARIFDPFFTTKLAGRGLGLAVVQAIVRAHRGAIFVAPPGEGGTAVQVWLPSNGGNSVQASSFRTMAMDQPFQGSGTILVVEDEALLRIAVAKMLRKVGFTVIEAPDGSAAVDLIEAHDGDLDAVLLDATLPGVVSREVFASAQRAFPNAKVILTSAYSKEAVDNTFGEVPIERFIRKPFQFEELQRMLRHSLHS
jgi:two-component system, cell cycle sensor histidine kinase and response regulator CckA